MDTRHLVTHSLVAVNVAVFAAGVLYGIHTDLIAVYGFSSDALRAGAYHVAVTAGFLHTGIPHLFYNMLFLLVAGHATEEELGHTKTLIIYFAGMVAGSLFFALLFPDASAVGASGAVFALLAAGMLLEPGRPVHEAVPVPLGLVAVAYVIPAAANAFNLAAGVANIAHVGGALAGAALAFHWEPKRARRGLVAVIGFTVLLLALGAF